MPAWKLAAQSAYTVVMSISLQAGNVQRDGLGFGVGGEADGDADVVAKGDGPLAYSYNCHSLLPFLVSYRHFA